MLAVFGSCIDHLCRNRRVFNPRWNESPANKRHRLKRRKQVVEEYFDGAPVEHDWNPRYNIALTQNVPILRQNPKEPVRENKKIIADQSLAFCISRTGRSDCRRSSTRVTTISPSLKSYCFRVARSSGSSSRQPSGAQLK